MATIGGAHSPNPDAHPTQAGFPDFVSPWIDQETLSLWRPTKYTGAKDIDTIDDFTEHLVRYIRKIRVPEEEQVSWCAEFLNGEARAWWRDLKRTGTTVSTMDDFIKALTGKFRPGGAQVSALHQLFELKQGRQPVSAFNRKFRQIAVEVKEFGLDSTNQANELKKIWLRNIANPTLQLIAPALQARDMSLMELMRFTERYDDFCILSGGREPADIKPAANVYEPEPMHVDNVTAREIQGVTQGRGAQKGGYNNQKSKSNNQQYKEYKGKNNNNNKNYDNKQPLLCEYCNKKGHAAKDCYSRKADLDTLAWIRKNMQKKGNDKASSQQSEK